MPVNNSNNIKITTVDSTQRDRKRRHATQASNDTTSTSLTPLEERVLQQTTPYYNYNVFDDANILSMCDDETALLAATDPNTIASGSTKTSAVADNTTKADIHGTSTGWDHQAGGSSATRTSGGVLDRYGGRLALRSKRLARMMVSQGRRNGSTNGGGGAAYSSPRVPKLHATKDDNSSLSPPSLIHHRQSSHPQRKSRFHMIRPPRPSALFRSHGQRQAAVDNHRVMNSGSFEMANYSGSGSTSAILQQQQQQQQQNGDKKKNAGVMRRVRKAISRFIWPGGINRFGVRDGGSYTEFVGFLLAFALASVAFIMWGTLVPKALCSTDMTFTVGAMNKRRFVAANGIVSDFTLTRSSFGSAMRGYSGYDISMLFPPLGQLSKNYWDHLPGTTQKTLENCLANQTIIDNFLNTWRANSTLYRGEPEMFPSQCPLPEAPQTSGANCMVMDWGEFASSKVGMLKLNMTAFKDRHSSPTTAWVVIDDMVYDVSTYVSYVSEEIIVNDTVQSDRRLIPENMLLPEELTKLFIKNPGEDISQSFHSLKSDDLAYKPCMDALFLRGTTLTTKSPFACANTNIVAWVTFGFYFLILFSRMAIAEIHAQVRARQAVATLPASTGSFNDGETGVGGGEESKGEGDEIAKCLVVVPCFRENMETLSGTLQSIARSAHDDAHKVLWIINDGDTEVLDGIMRILAHSGRSSDPKFYGAYGADSAGDGYGAARVHSGFYECGRHRIPYIVTAKETFQGSVDTIMIVLNFFRNLSSSSSSSSSSNFLRQDVVAGSTIFLEEEIEAQMTALGHPPAGIDYCMMIDGSVQMDPLAITQFVARMETCPEIVALSGSLYPVGRATSVLQILRLFDFYLQYFVSPICESLSNVTCPLNQLFCMYRVRLDDGSFCLGDEQFVASMDALMRGSVRCRHLTWPANDCLLVPRITRRFPQCRWAFESNGRAEIELTAHRMAAFDPYERQWFRTRLMTLFDILRGRTLKRTWPIMLAHLMFPFVAPAAACMLYLEIVISIFGDSPAIVVSEITAGFVGGSLLLLLLSRRWAMALYFLVYCAIAVPFYLVWIPVTSFITMNRVWSPPEQLEARRQRVDQLDRPQELEEAMKRQFSNVHNNQEGGEKKRRRWRHRKQSSSSQSSSMGGGVEWRRRKQAVVLQMQQKQQQLQQQQQQQRQQQGGGGGSSDSEVELVEETPMSSGALSRVVVGEGLATETRRVLQRVLAEYHPQRVEPESKEFYVVCERALMALIQAFPQVSVPELAVAVDRTIDELLSTTRGLVPPPPIVAPYQTHKFTKQGSGSGYLGTGRPVSVILEEE